MVVGNYEFIPDSQPVYLCKHNFIVVSVNYRLCPQISWYDGPCMDAKDCLEWCRTDLAAMLEARSDFGGAKADPTKIVVFGHSAGGTLALWLVSSFSSELGSIILRSSLIFFFSYSCVIKFPIIFMMHIINYRFRSIMRKSDVLTKTPK